TLNTGPAPPSGDAGCSLSRILQDNPPRKYYLTRKACLGILRRAKKRGKPLPPQLHAALLVQAGLISQDNISPGKETSGRSSLHGNCLTPWDTQRARIFTPDSVAPTVAGADGGGGRNPAGLLFAAGFLAGQGSAARGIGYQPECSPTLKAAESGSNMVPSVLCLNDQSGSAMDCSPNMFSTPMGLVRTKEQRHQPLVFEGHGIDSRYTGPHPIVPTLSARAGTGGNNLPLALQPEPTMCICGNAIDRQPRNGGNGIGIQTDVAYTLTGADRHAVFRRQWVDKFREGQSASTQSARQGKDATDLICQPSRDTPAVLLIRRLTPLECERLRGFPDGWTDLPGASDSARYTALGNSVAIPCVEYIMAGIAWAAEGD
ncbi:DNA cytosine methyltransferase, partial [Flavonifractor plautii]|nr:DNA cytosine methyltransferase [Flavonifractor plautii]